uniref:Uncharacterized protein n=1 Tax=Knipowitschia caucasica TaxID=637954 RepID=A0AAV2L455_KNICA
MKTEDNPLALPTHLLRATALPARPLTTSPLTALYPLIPPPAPVQAPPSCLQGKSVVLLAFVLTSSKCECFVLFCSAPCFDLTKLDRGGDRSSACCNAAARVWERGERLLIHAGSSPGEQCFLQPQLFSTARTTCGVWNKFGLSRLTATASSCSVPPQRLCPGEGPTLTRAEPGLWQRLEPRIFPCSASLVYTRVLMAWAQLLSCISAPKRMLLKLSFC